MKFEEVILRDTRANQPAATTVPIGTVYYVTDESVTERSNGTTWQSISDGGTVANNSITNAKLADVATATFKGRTTAATGDPEDLTVAQATALLNVLVGDSGAGGIKGLAPAPAAGDAAALKFLKADATWAVPAGSGGNAVRVDRALTAAEIRSLNSTPIALVAAPGADKIIVPIRILYWATRTATAYSADMTFRIRYNSIATDLFGGVSFSFGVGGVGDTFRDLIRTDYNFGYGGSNPRDKALEISASADTTTGTGTVKVSVVYYVGQW